ncbi:MAG: hypothetical protein ACFE9R_12100, partial [Candidatus Hermodarchaeota archaeon]
MRKLNIDLLLNTPIYELVENIKITFKELIVEIENYLNLEPIDNRIEISITEKEVIDSNAPTDIFSTGVDRFYENNVLNIRIDQKFLNFVPIIMLREAYKCFIPLQVSKLEVIGIFINQKVAIDLEKLESIKEWNSLIGNKVIDYGFISREFDRLENFLKQGSPEQFDSPFIFFFKYIRKNIQIIREKEKDFYDTFFEEFIKKILKKKFNEEIIETIYVLVKIFKKVQYYTALLDYNEFFKKFKKQEILQTNLSLNKFTENMQWIKQFSTISPSYLVNWPALNISSVNCYMKFNPALKRPEIYQVVNELPFFVLLKECRYSFAYEIDGFFVIPNQYYNDLKEFLKKLEDNGYVLEIKFNLIKKNERFVNINYFRKYHNNKTLVNNKNKLYDQKYELSNSIEYGKDKYKMALIDWLIIDRIRYYSQTGFNFERRAGTLKLLKSDLINEVISQRKFIADLKKNLLVMHSSSVLRESFLEFVKKNESFGFFFIRNILSKYVTLFNLIKEFITKSPSINNVSEFYECFKRSGVSYSIENNILFNRTSFRNTIFKEILPIYFKSKELFESEFTKFQNFLNIFNTCYDLKIFNLLSIRRIVQNKSLLDTIFKSKEEKLNNSYENFELSDITFQLVEDKLTNFLNNNPPIIQPDLINTILPTPEHFFALLLKINPKTREILNRITFIAKSMGIVQNNLLYVAFFLPYLNNEEKSTLISIFNNLFEEDLLTFKR